MTEKPTGVKVKFDMGIFLLLGRIIVGSTFDSTASINIPVRIVVRKDSLHLYIAQLNARGWGLWGEEDRERGEKSSAKCDSCEEAKDVLRPDQSRMHCGR